MALIWPHRCGGKKRNGQVGGGGKLPGWSAPGCHVGTFLRFGSLTQTQGKTCRYTFTAPSTFHSDDTRASDTSDTAVVPVCGRHTWFAYALAKSWAISRHRMSLSMAQCAPHSKYSLWSASVQFAERTHARPPYPAAKISLTRSMPLNSAPGKLKFWSTIAILHCSATHRLYSAVLTSVSPNTWTTLPASSWGKILSRALRATGLSSIHTT